MGIHISGIVIDSLPLQIVESELDPKKLKTKWSLGKLESLSPEKLNIGFKGNCTYIFLDLIFYKNISDSAELTLLETDLYRIFGDCNILIIAISDSTDITGFSHIKNGLKQRTKMVIGEQIFLDYGELAELELEMLAQFERLTNGVKPKSLDPMRETYPKLSEDKYYLIYRDGFIKRYDQYKQYGIDLPYFYKDGSCDQERIEQLVQEITGDDIAALMEVDCIILERKRLNFKKDSLLTYVQMAADALIKR